MGPGRMHLPLVRHLGQVYRLLRRQHGGFERDDDIDLALALQVGERRPSDKTTIGEEPITSASHRSLLQQGTAHGHIVPLDRRHRHLRQQTSAVQQRPQRGELVAARMRPVLVFAHPATLLCPGLSSHLHRGRIENVQLSPPAQACILQHRHPNMLVVPTHQLRGDLMHSGCGLDFLYSMLDGPA
jgi:hypothetical protein